MKDEILAGVSTVIARCKNMGVRLWAVPDGEERWTLQGTAETARGKLVRLHEALTQDGNSLLAPNDAGVTGKKSNWLVSSKDFDTLNRELLNGSSEVRRLSTWPIRRCFVFVDVSDFSRQRAGQQALIIGSIIAMVRGSAYWNHPDALKAWKDLEAMLCIGDGYIFVLRDVVCATYFAAYLAQLVEVRVARRLVPVEFHFRMGVHVGPVYCFWDWGRGGHESAEAWVEKNGHLQRTEVGSWNYIGEGINGGQRVLSVIGKETDDVLFISGQVRQALTSQDDGSSPCREILNCLSNRGRREDKHHNTWRVYEVNHTSLCGQRLAEEALS